MRPDRWAPSGIRICWNGQDERKDSMNPMRVLFGLAAIFAVISAAGVPVNAQTRPTPAEISRYTGLLEAAARGDAGRIKKLTAGATDPDVRDGYGRTGLHIAAYEGHHDAMRALVEARADPNALENDRYDIVTIAAVGNDIPTLKVALELGGSARNITSIYDGTALIAAAHLGHAEVVRILIEAGAPLDHVNNLGWTALIESIVLGNGGPDHTRTLRLLVEAGADVTITDGNGQTPLSLARERRYREMVSILERSD